MTLCSSHLRAHLKQQLSLMEPPHKQFVKRVGESQAISERTRLEEALERDRALKHRQFLAEFKTGNKQVGLGWSLVRMSVISQDVFLAAYILLYFTHARVAGVNGLVLSTGSRIGSQSGTHLARRCSCREHSYYTATIATKN